MSEQDAKAIRIILKEGIKYLEDYPDASAIEYKNKFMELEVSYSRLL